MATNTQKLRALALAAALFTPAVAAQVVAASPLHPASTAAAPRGPYFTLPMPATCTQRVVGGHGYYFCPGARGYREARAFCRAFGTELAILSDRYENDAAAAIVRELGRGRHLIGYSDEMVEGSFVTANGTPMTFSGWAADEPNNASDEDCVELDGSGIWNDNHCDAVPNVLCEEAAACNTEVFGDRLYHFCRTAPGDDPDAVCRQVGGALARLDTAAEERFVAEHGGAVGLACGGAPAAGAGAVVCETERPCARRFYNGGMYLFCVGEGVTAVDARRACERMGADLATVPDAAMNDWLYGNFALFRRTHFYIDLRDDDREGAFYTRHGPATFAPWAPGEPNDQNDEDCVEAADQGWNDVPCRTAPRGGFVCAVRPRGPARRGP